MGNIANQDIFEEDSYKVFGKAGSRDHGIATWICMVDGTVTYAAAYSGTTIYEWDGTTENTLVSSTSGPARGTFSATAGNFYYATKPIHFFVEGAHHSIAPMTMAGHYFFLQPTRNDPTTFYVYSYNQGCTVEYYVNTVDGVETASPTGSTINADEVTSIELTTGLNVPVWIRTSVPAVITCKQSSDDMTILAPAGKDIYTHQSGYSSKSITNRNPTAGTYHLTDENPVGAMLVGDGAGFNYMTGLSYDNLSDSYVYGGTLSDYVIVAPWETSLGYSVSVFYHNGTNWVLHDSHTFNGPITKSSPGQVEVDGDNDGTFDDSGLATNIASGENLWLFQSEYPFYLRINDPSDDEMFLLGYMKDRQDRYKIDTGKALATNPEVANVGVLGDATMRNINILLNGYTEDTSVSTVVGALEGAGFKVFACAIDGGMMENLSGESGSSISTAGDFLISAFNSVSDYIALGDSFSTSTLNGHPVIFMAAFADNAYHGCAAMIYRDYTSSTTLLKDLFYPNQFRNLYARVLFPDDTFVEDTGTTTSTIISDNQSPGVNGYYDTSKFSLDDGILGFRIGAAVDGNGGPYLSASPSNAFGIENANSNDASADELYWGESSAIVLNGDYKLYLFVKYS